MTTRQVKTLLNVLLNMKIASPPAVRFSKVQLVVQKPFWQLHHRYILRPPVSSSVQPSFFFIASPIRLRAAADRVRFRLRPSGLPKYRQAFGLPST
jgi:hypothetical protein